MKTHIHKDKLTVFSTTIGLFPTSAQSDIFHFAWFLIKKNGWCIYKAALSGENFFLLGMKWKQSLYNFIHLIIRRIFYKLASGPVHFKPCFSSMVLGTIGHILILYLHVTSPVWWVLWAVVDFLWGKLMSGRLAISEPVTHWNRHEDSCPGASTLEGSALTSGQMPPHRARSLPHPAS